MIPITAHYFILIPIAAVLHQEYTVQLYKWEIHLQSFLPLIGIENITKKENNTLFDFSLDFYQIKTTLEISILAFRGLMIILLRTTFLVVPKQVVFLVSNMYLRMQGLNHL